jgi:hypothetical protein
VRSKREQMEKGGVYIDYGELVNGSAEINQGKMW